MVHLTDTAKERSGHKTAIIAIAVTKSVYHNVGTKIGGDDVKLWETVLLWCKYTGK
jgi:hypothetical protein